MDGFYPEYVVVSRKKAGVGVGVRNNRIPPLLGTLLFLPPFLCYFQIIRSHNLIFIFIASLLSFCIYAWRKRDSKKSRPGGLPGLIYVSLR